MPQNNDTDEQVVELTGDEVAAAEAQTQAPPTPAPAYVPLEAFQAFQERITEQFAGLTNAVLQSRAPAAPTTATVLPAEPTEDEWTTAYESGDARQIARLTRRANEAQAARLESRLTAQLGEVRNLGVGSIAQLAQAVGVKDLPHYTRFKREIDAHIATLPAEQRLNPEVFKYAHDMVVGAHASELIAEAVEAKGRQATTEAAPGAPKGKAGRQVAAQAKEAQTLDEMPGGSDARQALDYLGIDEDAFAKRLGYESWEDYVSADATPAGRKKKTTKQAATTH